MAFNSISMVKRSSMNFMNQSTLYHNTTGCSKPKFPIITVNLAKHSMVLRMRGAFN
jgi:hypothetical protein